eukprot:TRINITY_DN205_c0_g1_i8.p1 TRINITY_DN205_c0_g1~~TRINITY_DN205_c0_g1_i8.p1  ORF type:complete len:723 (+),score=109.97 TRINITY_DN205_c0_g1_i8:136-2304(+)
MAVAQQSTFPASANSGTHSYFQSCSFPTNFKFSLVPASTPRKKKCTYLPILVLKATTDKAVESETENTSVAEQLKSVVHECLESAIASPVAKATQEFSQIKPLANPESLRKSVSSPERQRRLKNQTPNSRDKPFSPLLKVLNDCQNTRNDISEILNSINRVLTPREATFILNNINTWQKSYWFFQWLDNNSDFEMNKIVYNVTMKALRRGRQWDLIEDLIQSMAEKGIDPDNFTYSTIINSATRCGLPNKAIEWFERMIEAQCLPDGVTYNAMIDAYGKAGKVQEALSLYETAKADGWRPGHITYASLLRMYSICGNVDGALAIFKEMKDSGVKSDLIVYNNMLSVLMNAQKPALLKSIYEEMLAQGLKPNEVTLTYLLRGFGEAGRADDAFRLWETVNEQGWAKDTTLCNTMLTLCAGFGRLDMAEKIFLDMLSSREYKPDEYSYSSMVRSYTKQGLIEEANGMLVRMREAGFKCGMMNYTHLLYCYGKAKQFDEVVRVFNQVLDEGLSPDDKLCGCLLTVLSFCENGEVDKILVCLERANPDLASMIRMLQWEKLDDGILKEQFSKVFNETSKESRMTFCNFLIDFSYTFNFPERGQQILSLALFFDVYPRLHSKSSKEWCLDVTRLSFHAALAAFRDWMSNITEALENAEEIPPSFAIHTGLGRHHHLQEHSLASALETALKKDSAPFQRSTEKGGCFFATQEELLTWMQSKPPLLRMS